jgi:hypothetical protein
VILCRLPARAGPLAAPAGSGLLALAYATISTSLFTGGWSCPVWEDTPATLLIR